MKRSAFTMIELILAIVVISILAMMALPRLDRDLRQEAADSVLSNIRYTQHLALIDDKHKFNESSWQRAFWKISFEACSDGGIFVGMGTDMDYEGDTDKEEAALDPSNGKPMFWMNTSACKGGGDSTVSSNIFLTKKFGISSVVGTGGCGGKHIGFDHLGRPHVNFTASTTPDSASYMKTACNFKFTLSNGDAFDISIQPESGYAHIVGQEGS